MTEQPLWEPQNLHGVISQKIELFITTAVRTSDPTRRYIPEDRTLHNLRCGNIKSYMLLGRYNEM
jgi:hypothetical protein